MRVGEYEIRTDLKWSKDYEELEAYLTQFEQEIAACEDNLSKMRAMMKGFVERYLELRNKIDHTALPIGEIMRQFDHKLAWRLWREAASFFG